MERGIVKKVVLEVGYPDGTSTEVVLNPGLENIEGIAWNKKLVEAVHKTEPSFFKCDPKEWDADDWKKRPTVALFFSPNKEIGRDVWPVE